MPYKTTIEPGRNEPGSPYGRRERINFEGATYHIVSRCNNKLCHFNDQIHFDKYITILKRYKEKYGFLLHHYAIMNNHVHLLIKLENTIDISKIMHSINCLYARWYNTTHDKTGHFWENRFYGNLILDDMHLLTALVYIDVNPLRAKLCKNPYDWKYSGSAFYHMSAKNELIDTPDIYLNLGENDEMRQKTYTRIVNTYYLKN